MEKKEIRSKLSCSKIRKQPNFLNITLHKTSVFCYEKDTRSIYEKSTEAQTSQMLLLPRSISHYHVLISIKFNVSFMLRHQ